MISRDKCFPNFEFELPRPRMVRDIDMRGKATSSQLPPGLYSPRVRTGKLGALSSPRRRAVKHWVCDQTRPGWAVFYRRLYKHRRRSCGAGSVVAAGEQVQHRRVYALTPTVFISTLPR